MKRIRLLATPDMWHMYIRVNVLTAVLLAMLALSLHAAQVAQAATTNAQSSLATGLVIHWNTNMIYAGQNNGLPWGPVGENAGVSTSGFPPNLQLHLVLVAGDSNLNHNLCREAGSTVGTVTTNGSGAFQLNFTWPSGASQVNSKYSICGISAVDGSVISHEDDGPFTVLAASPPTISVSPTTVSPQGTITFSGQNWVPPQAVSISVSNNAFGPIAANSTGLNSGTFSVSFVVPSSTQAGSYTFTGSTANKLLASGTISLTVNVLPTPTPTATATATATDTPTATDTSTATTGTPTATVDTTTTNNSSNDTGTTSGGNGGQLLLVGLIVSAIVILLAGAGLVIFLIMQRRNATPDSPPGSSLPINAYSQPMQTGSYSDFGPPMQPGPFNSYDQATQQGIAYPGYGPPQPPMQQGATSPGFAPMPANSYGSTGVITPLCMNCGMPLAPNDMRCNRCGMPVGAGAQNPNTPNWGR